MHGAERPRGPDAIGEAATGNGWQQGALVEILLPSGISVRLVRPSLRQVMRHGLLPGHLHEAALNSADPEWLTSAEHGDERQSRVGEYLCWMVAWAVREVRPDGGEWATVQLTAEGVADNAFDPPDQDVIEDVILRDRIPEDVTLYSRLMRGERVLDAEGEEVAIPGWAPFRGEPGVAETGEDGAGVVDAPEPAAVGGR